MTINHNVVLLSMESYATMYVQDVFAEKKMSTML